MKRAITVLVIIVAIGAGAGAYYLKRSGGDVTVNTAPVTRGDILDTVGATGTMQAVTTVQVGSQVSGNISFLGADFNSIVHKNQVIARLDPSLFQAQVEQERANLVKSRADVERNRVALVDAQQKFTRSKELAARSLVPQSDLDAAKIAVDSAQAQLQSSQATVVQAQASLSQSQVNLDHCIITAPIDGIVIQRSVDVGQTVAASLQSPTLFIIAADLTKMQVNANIDEADVGRIRPGQEVVFRVDAYPTDDFHGVVSQIRLQPVVVQNVTTYGTIVDVPNNDLRLKPGMTANLKVQIAKRTDVLRVPNAALRFRPTADTFTALGLAVPAEVQGGARGRQGGTAGAGATAASGAAAANSGTAGARGAAAPPSPATTPPATSATPGQAAPAGAAGGQDAADRLARTLERFKGMSADEQKQFLARMKARGVDTSMFEKSAATAPAIKPGMPPKPKYGAPQAAETIDALFAPLPPTESFGRAWVYMDKQLKPVRLRLGITDGQFSELLSGELQANMELVTGVVGVTATRSTTGAANPLMGPQRGRGR